MTAYTINVAPYVDLDYVAGGYLDDNFVLTGIDTELRATGGLLTSVTPFAYTTYDATLKSNRKIAPSSRSFSLSLIAAGLRSQRFQRAHVTPFQLTGILTPTFANWRTTAQTAQFLLNGIGISFGQPVRPVQDGLGVSRDISDQSKDFEDLRKGYGGSDNTSPSFLRPQHVRNNSLLKSRDLGPLQALDAEFRGRIGTEVGASTIYLKLELTETAKIKYNKLAASNKYDDRQVSIGLLDDSRKPIPLDTLGFASPTQAIEGTSQPPAQEGNPQFLPTGTYYFTVASNQWRAADFGVRILIGGFVSLSGTTSFELLPTARVAQSYLSGTALLEDRSFATIAQTRSLGGVSEARLEPTLTLTRTSPYSTT